MIKAIVLDDGHHERTVVINYGINYAKKSLSSFVNELCSSHSADYQVKTACFEDLQQSLEFSFNELYNKFEKHSPRTTSYFTLLWSSEDLIDGIDIY